MKVRIVTEIFESVGVKKGDILNARTFLQGSILVEYMQDEFEMYIGEFEVING